MKQTNIKYKARYSETFDNQQCSLNGKSYPMDINKTPTFDKRNRELIIKKTLHQEKNLLKFASACKRETKAIEYENIKESTVLPLKLQIKNQPSVNCAPLQLNKITQSIQNSRREIDLVDSLNISAYLHTDESGIEEKKGEIKKKEMNEYYVKERCDKNRKDILHKQIQSRDTSTRVISSKSLVKKKSEIFPCAKIKTELSSNHSIVNDISNCNYSNNKNKSTSTSTSTNSDLFEYENEKEIELSISDKEIYGDRQLFNYRKQKLLGKGGCGIVWLCVNQENGKEYAIKQISKKTKKTDSPSSLSRVSQMAKKEIEILTFISVKLSDTHDENINSMINYYEYFEDNNDLWLVFEKGGKSLSALSLKIKGEFCGTERIYSMKQGRFLHKLVHDLSQLKLFIKKMLCFIQFLSSNNIVHSDIKPDNILIDYFKEDYSIRDIKVIDFGSAYFLTKPSNFSSNTPEYMSPEITKLLETNKSTKDIVQFLNKFTEYPWCIDMWSLGVSLLEIVLACPLWMSYKSKVSIWGKAIFKTGLFGVKGRDGNKIYTKQIEVSKSLTKLLRQSLIENQIDRDSFCDLLSKMLEINYTQRISPSEALKHPFLA